MKPKGKRMHSGVVLDEAEVKRRLGSYYDTGVTDELYDYGKLVFTETKDRFKLLESKAMGIAAYAIGMITLLASTSTLWKNSLTNRDLVLLALVGLAAVVSAFSAILSLRLREMELPSQDEWLNQETLDDREQLRRYHLLSLWGTINSYRDISEFKAERIQTAQWALFGASLFLVAFVLARRDTSRYE